jgi:hypothetical protein
MTMRTDVLAELKALRLHGMAQAWGELQAQGNHHGLQTEGWLIEHLLRAEHALPLKSGVLSLVENTDKESRNEDKQVRAQYTQEFKLEAVRQVQSGQAIAVVAKVLGIPKASLGNWVGSQPRGIGRFAGGGDKVVRSRPSRWS